MHPSNAHQVMPHMDIPLIDQFSGIFSPDHVARLVKKKKKIKTLLQAAHSSAYWADLFIPSSLEVVVFQTGYYLFP